MGTERIERAMAERSCRKCGSEKIVRKYYPIGSRMAAMFRADSSYFRMEDTQYNYDGTGVQMSQAWICTSECIVFTCECGFSWAMPTLPQA
jgi:hypothetical protein